MASSLDYLFYARSMPLRFVLHPFVFFSVLWCMAWMLSIKYFVFFYQILRFFLNWRPHLQNGVFFDIYINVRSITLRFVLHPFVFFSVLCVWLECYRSNTLSFLLKLSRISLNWRTHLQNDAIFGIFILRQINAPKVCITSVCVFISSLMYGLNVIDQILCHIYSNFKIFPKLTDTSPKWRHLWNFICLR